MESKEDMLKEFQDYKYWREVQRNQLTTSSNIYFGFSSAIIGYSINFLISDKFKMGINLHIKTLLVVGVSINLLSLIFYAFSANNRLNDYRRTAMEIYDGSTINQIRNRTANYGIKTWDNYTCQKLSFAIGFVLCLIAFSFIIFQK